MNNESKKARFDNSTIEIPCKCYLEKCPPQSFHPFLVNCSTALLDVRSNGFRESLKSDINQCRAQGPQALRFNHFCMKKENNVYTVIASSKHEQKTKLYSWKHNAPSTSSHTPPQQLHSSFSLSINCDFSRRELLVVSRSLHK